MVVISDNGGIPYDPNPLIAGQSLIQFQAGGFPHRWTTGVDPTFGQTFESVGGKAVIDGCWQAPYAFASAQNNVTIRNLEIRNFHGKYQGAAVQAFPYFAGDNLPLNQQGVNWVLDDLWVHSNGGIGVGLSTNTTLSNSRISHNGAMGLHSKGGSNSVVEDSEVHHNNIDRHLSVEEAGGTKFKYTDGYIIRRNYFHDNWGYGIWFDICNGNATINNNLVEDHERAGIFWEINDGPVLIRQNTVRRAGIAYNGWVFGGGITTSTSAGPVTVQQNQIEESANGITFLNQGQRDTDPCSDPTTGIVVTDNVIVDSGQSGIENDNQGPTGALPQINQWDRNEYIDICVGTATCGFQNPSTGGQPFRIGSFTSVTFSQWQALGRDANGSASGCTPV